MSDTVECCDEQPMKEVDVPKGKGQGKGGGNPRLAEARLKAHETRRQMGIISRAKKAQAKAERDNEYKKALEFLNGPPKEVVEPVGAQAKPKSTSKPPRKAKVKTIEISDSSSSSESSDSDSDSSVDVVRVIRKPKSKAKSKPPPKKKRKVVEESEDSDEDNTILGGQVARDMLTKRVLQRAADDAIRRLVPGFKGF